MEKKISYGSISFTEQSGTYLCEFRNPFLKKKTFIKRFAKYEEAFEALMNENFEFFKAHSFLLPKCISINSRDQNYRFYIVVNGVKTYVDADKDLDELYKRKIEFINNLL